MKKTTTASIAAAAVMLAACRTTGPAPTRTMASRRCPS